MTGNRRRRARAEVLTEQSAVVVTGGGVQDLPNPEEFVPNKPIRLQATEADRQQEHHLLPDEDHRLLCARFVEHRRQRAHRDRHEPGVAPLRRAGRHLDVEPELDCSGTAWFARALNASTSLMRDSRTSAARSLPAARTTLPEMTWRRR